MKKLNLLLPVILLTLSACNAKKPADESNESKDSGEPDISESTPVEESESQGEKEIPTLEQLADAVVNGRYAVESTVFQYDEGAKEEEKSVDKSLVEKEANKYALYHYEDNGGYMLDCYLHQVDDEISHFYMYYDSIGQWIYQDMLTSYSEEYLMDYTSILNAMATITELGYGEFFELDENQEMYHGEFTIDDLSFEMNIYFYDEFYPSLIEVHAHDSKDVPTHQDMVYEITEYGEMSVELPNTYLNDVVNGVNAGFNKVLASSNLTLEIEIDGIDEYDGSPYHTSHSYKVGYRLNEEGAPLWVAFEIEDGYIEIIFDEEQNTIDAAYYYYQDDSGVWQMKDAEEEQAVQPLNSFLNIMELLATIPSAYDLAANLTDLQFNDGIYKMIFQGLDSDSFWYNIVLNEGLLESIEECHSYGSGAVYEYHKTTISNVGTTDISLPDVAH